MLKGKTIIELTDVKTGKKERYEDENMVTNALKHIFEPLGHYKNPSYLFTSSDVLPYYQKLLGGILLFDGEIDEDREMLFAPAGVNLTACGVYGKQNDGAGTCRGDFNTTESEVNLTDKYVKYVYDFTTSQGNGAIASVCLTSNIGGYNGYGSGDAVFTNTGTNMSIRTCDCILDFMGGMENTAYRGTSNTAGVTQYLFTIDPENDILYYLRMNSAKSLSIVKRKGYFKSLSVFDTPSKSGNLIEVIDLPDLSTGMYHANYLVYNYVAEENCIYIYAASSGSVNAGGAFNIIRIDCTNWSVTENPMTNQCNETIYVTNNRCYAYDGYFYAKSYNSPYCIYKIKIGNSADVVKILIPSTAQHDYTFPCYAVNGRIFYDTYSHNYMNASERNLILNTQRDEITLSENRSVYGYYTSTQPCGVQVMGHKECVYWRGYFFYPSMYLATINNLGSPVTKTADKTMKVTYIIQEHEN